MIQLKRAKRLYRDTKPHHKEKSLPRYTQNEQNDCIATR